MAQFSHGNVVKEMETSTRTSACTTRVKKIGKQMGRPDDQEDMESPMGNVTPYEQSGSFKLGHQKGQNSGGRRNQRAICRRSTNKNGVAIQGTLEQTTVLDIIEQTLQKVGMDQNSTANPGQRSGNK